METLVSLFLLLSMTTAFSKPQNPTQKSSTQAVGRYTQTSPPPTCDPTSQNCS